MKFKLLAILTYLVHVFIFIMPSYAMEDSEVKAKLQEIANDPKLTVEQRQSMALQFLSILTTKQRLAYYAIREPCEKDFAQFCPDVVEIPHYMRCIRDNRHQLSEACEHAYKLRYGSKPLNQSEVFNGVNVPKGSTYFYDSNGEVLGMIAAENVTYRGIQFRKGQIRFHTEGISVGHLVVDQYINGIKYAADGIGPFFFEDGDVENATLAESTEIGGILYQGGSQIRYYCRGIVRTGVVARDVVIHGRTYKRGDRVSFERDGRPRDF